MLRRGSPASTGDTFDFGALRPAFVLAAGLAIALSALKRFGFFGGRRS